MTTPPDTITYRSIGEGRISATSPPMRMLLVSICLVLSVPALGASPTVSEMPDLGLRVNDSIDAADFSLNDQYIDVVWLASMRESSRLSHRRLALSTGTWGAVTSISVDARPPLRLVQSNGQLHVVAGPSLQHFFSLNEGRSWQRLPDLLPKGNALALQAAADRGTLILAYLVRNRTSRGDSVEIWNTTLSSKGAAHRSLVGTFPGGPTQPDPKLIVDHGEYHLFGAINQVARPAADGELSENGRLFYASSRNGGRTWSRLCVVGVLGIINNRARAEGNGYVSHLDAIRFRGRFYLLYNASWLYMTSSADGLRWSEATVLVGVRRTWEGSARNSSVAAAVYRDHGRVLWIDERFQRTDSSPTNPFGFHWLMNPNWANNDVLSMPIAALTRTVKPTRLTPNLSYASALRAIATRDRVYALWIGRAKVGRELTSYGSPPSLFIASLPMD